MKLTGTVLGLLCGCAMTAAGQNGWRMSAYDGSATNNSPAYGPTTLPVFQPLITSASGNLSRIARDGSLLLYNGNNLTYYSKAGTLKWTATVGAVSDIAIGPSGTIYTSTPASISAWDQNSGQPAWPSPYNINFGNETSGLVIDSGGTIYTVTGASYVGPPNKVTAINPNGTLKWEIGASFRGYSRFVLGTDESTGYFLDLTNSFSGVLSWERGLSTSTGEDVYGNTSVVRSNTWAFAPWNTLYTGGLNGLLGCSANLSNCNGLRGDADGVVTFTAQGTIITGGFNGRLMGIDQTGNQLWSASEQYSGGFSDANGTFYTTAPQTNDLVALNGNTGAQLWRQHFASAPAALLIGDDNSIYVSVGSTLYKSASGATPTFIESFNNAPDYSNNWTIAFQSGSPTFTYTPGNFRIQSPAVCTGPSSGTGIGFRSKQAFIGDLDVSFQLNHTGYGRTSVYLWADSANQPVIGADLDTNDTNYLNFSAGQNSSQYAFSSSPYLNKWITLRIQVIAGQVNFYADSGLGLQLLQTFPKPMSSPLETYTIVFSAGSVCWKSGPNDTSFRLIQATGTAASFGGTISVSTNLQLASFTIAGPTTYTGGGKSFVQNNAAPGTYTIAFDTIFGYSTPSSQTITLSPGGQISFTGAYTLLGVGTVMVSTNVPQAGFSISPGGYIGTGPTFSQSNVPAGSYTISYDSVAGCVTTAPSETKTLAAGGTLSFIGTYQGCTGTIEVDSNIANATFTISHPSVLPVHGGGPYPVTLRNMPFDTYTVAFDPSNGYNTPSIAPKQIAVGSLTTFSGNFTVNGTAGLGRIIVTSNLDAASFGVVSTSSTSFTPFTRGGKFLDTLNTVPAGTYRISFSPVSGYYTPPDQTLTLNPSGTIQFSGTYRRMIVALFTGWKNRPTNNIGLVTYPGVTYPDTCDSSNCPGMAALAQELRGDAQLAPGIVARTFTFYDQDQYNSFPPITQDPGCAGQSLTQLIPANPECIAPSTDNDHQVAQAWIDSVAATPDDRIVVIGHSYGGNRARLFAQQLANKGYSVDGLLTVDPIDWDSCAVRGPGGFLVLYSGCDFSNVTAQSPSGLRSALSYTQTQSAALKGYHLSTANFNSSYILNDPACLPGIDNLFVPDLYCSHVSIASRKVPPSSGPGDVVHDGAIQFVRSVQQSPTQAISQIQTTSISTGSAVVSWKTQDDTQGGEVIFSLQQNFGGSLFAQEPGPAGKLHSVTLPGLQPDTTYYFKIQATPPGAPTPITSGVEWFHTMPTVPKLGATSWSLTTNGSTATLTFLLANSGAVATSGTITAAKVGAISATTPLPATLPDLTSIQPAVVSLTFPVSIGTVGTTVSVTVSVKYSGVPYTLSARSVQIQ